MKFCPNCGHKVNDNAQFCPNCGAKVPYVKLSSNMPKSFQNNVTHQMTTLPRRRHHGFIITLIIILIVLGIGGYKAKQYYTPARFLSWQMPHYTWMLGSPHHLSDYSYVVFGQRQLLGGADKNDDINVKEINSLSNNNSEDRKVRKSINKSWRSSQGEQNKNKVRYHIKGDVIVFGQKNRLKFINIQKHGTKYTFQLVTPTGERHAAYLKKYRKITPIK